MDASTLAPSLRNPTRSEIPGLLDELERSKGSVAEFARMRGLKPQAIYIARRKLKAQGRRGPVFDRVQLAGLQQATSTFELQLRSGHRLAIPSDFDVASLERLLDLLGVC